MGINRRRPLREQRRLARVQPAPAHVTDALLDKYEALGFTGMRGSLRRRADTDRLFPPADISAIRSAIDYGQIVPRVEAEQDSPLRELLRAIGGLDQHARAVLLAVLQDEHVNDTDMAKALPALRRFLRPYLF